MVAGSDREEATMGKAPGETLVCTSCGQTSVIQIEMTLPDGHVCEAKWWDKEGESIEVDGIIDLVRD